MPDKRPAADPARRHPRLIVTLGRQRTGKTLFAQWYAETAPRDLPLRILDADQGEQVLSDRLPDAEASPRSDDDRRNWLEGEVERQMTAAASDKPYDVLLDPGGNDPQVKRWGVELGLVDMLQSSGIDVIAIHLLGPDVADLNYMKEIETGNLFCPPKTVVILNKALVSPGQSPRIAFAEVADSETVRGIEGRGGRVVTMEALTDMPTLEKRKLRFADVIGGKAGVQAFAVARTRHWLNGPMAALRSELVDWIG
jgi:hypothetical protein